MINDSPPKKMMQNEVLVIEDHPDDIKCVRRSLPDSCSIVPVDPHFCKLCEKGIDGAPYLVTQADGTMARVYLKDYLDKILTAHYSFLRAIVCDLKLGKDRRGGVKVIKWIRDVSHNRIELHNNYLKFIPIIVYTSSTNSGESERREALEAGANAFILKNRKDISNGYGVDEKLRNVLKNDIDYFHFLCDSLQLNSKRYKVALSFTGGGETTYRREFIEEMAHLLYRYYTKEKVFYDIEKAEEGTMLTLTKEDFTKIYRNMCEYVVVCISEDYNTENSPWTQKEWEGIHDLYEKSPGNVIFVSLENGLTSVIFKKQLSITNEPIWIDASKLVEDFGKILCGLNHDQRAKLNEIIGSTASFKEYPLTCYKQYREHCHKIDIDVVKPIVSRITEICKNDYGNI